VRDRTEPSGTPAFISLGVDISISIETEFSLRKKRDNKLDLTDKKL
jgi:hypothetical protein